MEAIHSHDHEHEHDHDDSPLQDWLRAALLFGLGLYFVYNIVSGNLANYVNMRFAWLSYVAAAIFLLLGLSHAYALLPTGKRKRKNDEPAHHDHNHAQISWTALGVVAIPLVLGTLIPSRPLGAAAVDGDLTLNSAAAQNVATTTLTIAPLNRNVLDWLRVFNASTDYSEIEGQPADVIGFIYREPTFADDQFMLARFTISCCVADASAIGMPVAWADTTSLPADSWVRVKGTLEVGQFRGDDVPILKADSVEPIPQPEHPYLYP
jgi:putative membrane protein